MFNLIPDNIFFVFVNVVGALLLLIVTFRVLGELKLTSPHRRIVKSPETFLWLGDILPESGSGQKRVEINFKVSPLLTTSFASGHSQR